MAKSNKTEMIEASFLDRMYLKREFGIQEVTLGNHGVVDILGYTGDLQRNGRGKKKTRDVTWRCYEIKISKSDFYSKSKWTFIGHYNYFILPTELYPIVKRDIPDGIGVILAQKNPNDDMYHFYSKVNAKKQNLKGLSHEEVTDCMITSLSREVRKNRKSLLGIGVYTNRELSQEVARRKRGKIYVKR